jgi:hypothetical protein
VSGVKKNTVRNFTIQHLNPDHHSLTSYLFINDALVVLISHYFLQQYKLGHQVVGSTTNQEARVQSQARAEICFLTKVALELMFLGNKLYMSTNTDMSSVQ